MSESSSQNVGELLRGGPAAGQGGAAWLEHGAQLKQIPQLAPDLFQAGEAEVADLLHLPGDKGAPAPAHLQHTPVRQGTDGLPEGGPAHPQLLGQLQFVGQLFPGLELLLHHNGGVQTVRRLLGQVLSGHRDSPSFFHS